MNLRYDLLTEQKQKLVMKPELLQAIRILQFNTQELERFIEEQLLTNPVLEKPDVQDETGTDREFEPESEPEEVRGSKAEAIDWEEFLRQREYDDISYRQWEEKTPQEDFNFEQFISSEVTLAEHLLEQVDCMEMDKNLHALVVYIIETLDENGYFRASLEELSETFSLPQKRTEEALRIVQNLDPAGVGARDLTECLKIQLAAAERDCPEARSIVENHLEDLARNRLSNISRSLGIPLHLVQELADVIKSLEPKPGNQFSSVKENRYIIPDVTVEKLDGEYVVQVNESTAPRLIVSLQYQKILQESDKNSTLFHFLTDRLNSAIWLIRSIEHRRDTIRDVVSAVVRYQEEFFDYGPKHMKPLTLKQIAEEIGVHESTVSRSVNGKYMQTPRGMFEIKHFFTSGVHNAFGEGIASESVKTEIRELIGKENTENPMSDQAISNTLGSRGIEISRRTVAKYREEMGIPASSKRKRY